MNEEPEPVDRITIDAVGEPGRRTFLLQTRRGDRVVSLVIEKEQAIALGRGVEELLTRVGFPEPPLPFKAEEMLLDESVEPSWRVGSIEIGYLEQRDLMFVHCQEVTDEPNQESASLLFLLTRAQLGALGVRALWVAAKGRPRYPMCKLPIDPQGHVCPALNGHRRAGS